MTEEGSRKTRFQILNFVLSLEVAKGHLKWKVADVSRKLGVSRSLIYYHFGKSKEAILETCYEMIAEEFYGLGLNKGPLRALNDEILCQSLMKTQAIYLQNPAIVVFFHRWRIKPSSIQTQILKIETKFRSQLSQIFPELTPAEVLALHTLMHGVVTAPFATEESIKVVSHSINHFLKSRISPLEGLKK